MAKNNILVLDQIKLENEIVGCYSELFGLKYFGSIIKEGDKNKIELYTCFYCIKQSEYICKWCKENCHGKKYHQKNGKNNVEIQKMIKSQIKKISNFTCICKQQNHHVKKNTSYQNLYRIINDESNYDSNNFCNSMNGIIKLMMKNKDY